MPDKGKGISAVLGSIFILIVLLTAILGIAYYYNVFTRTGKEASGEAEYQVSREREVLKLVPQNPPVITVRSAWSRDSIVRYIVVLDVNDVVQTSKEVNVTVPADTSVDFNLQALGVPYGNKYLFVTALGNAFGPISFTYTLIVYVYRDGTNIGAQGAVVRVDNAEYVTDANGMISTLVSYGDHVIEIKQSNPATGVQLVFTKWSNGSTDNPRTFTLSQPTVLIAYAKVQYYLTMLVNPSNGGTTDPLSGWHDAGSEVQITAIPNSGFRFSGWFGTGSGSYTGIANPASVTMNGSITETANFVEVATVTFSVSGMSSDASGMVLVVDGTGYSFTQLPVSFTWDVGSSHSFSWYSPVSAGSNKRYVWVSTSGLSTAQSGTITVPSGGGTVAASYKSQYTVTLQTSGLPSDFTGNSVTFDNNGYRVYDGSPAVVWVDSGRTVSYSWSSPISSNTAGKRYVITSSQSGSVTVDSSKTVSATYKTQYYLTVNSDHDSPNPTSGWFDAGTQITASVTSPVLGDTGVQYVCTGWTGTGSVPSSGISTSVTFTINAPSSITWNWKIQYYLTMNVNPSGGGTVSPGSGWYDSGTQVIISATPASNYRFDSWSGSGTGSYSGTSNPATITMDSPITETANFVEIATVTFSTSGVSNDASGAVLTVDGTSYSYSQLPKSFTWDVGTSHSFSWSSPVPAGSGKQYVWTSSSGLSTSQSGTITVPSGGGSITASYKTQYYLTVTSTYGNPSPTSGWFDAGTQVTAIVSSPVSGGSGVQYVCTGWTGTGSVPSSGTTTSVTFTINAPSSITWNWKTQYYLTMQVSPSSGGTVSPSSGWYDSGAQVQISATPASNYRFDSWTGSGTGSYSGTSNPATVTMNAPITETANFVQVATITFSVSGMSSDASGTVLTVDGTSYSYSQLPKSFTWDVGSSHSFSWASPVSAGSGKQYVWTSTSGLSTSQSGTISVPAGGGSVSASYKTQYYLTVTSAYGSPNPTSGWFDAGTSITASVNSPVSGGTGIQYVCTGWTGSGSVPSSGTSTSTTFTINAPSSITWNWKTQYYLTMGVSPSGSGTTNPTGGWYDSGTQVQISATPNSGYAFSSWSGSGTGSYTGTANPATVTMNGPITETANFVAVATVTFSVSGVGSDVSGTVLTVDGTAYTYSQLPASFVWVVGSQHTFSWSSPVSAGSGKQYVWTSCSGLSTSQSGTVTVPSGGGSITASYKTQYYLTTQASPSSGGTVSPSSGWYDSGVQVQISATPASGYRFNGWTGSGTGSYTGTSNPATVTMNGPIMETANFVQIATVTFSISGASSDASGTVLTVDGTSYSYSQLPISFTWDVGSSHSFSWASPISAGTGKQYVWTSCSGLSTSQSGTITVPSGGGSITASYKTQYYLTMQANPSSGGTVSPSSGWYDSGSQVSISATPASNYRFNGWSGSGTGSYTGTNNPATVTMNGPITETANFVQVATITFSVSGMSSDASGTVLTVDGTSYSYSQLPKSFTWDVGTSHSFSWSSPVSAGSGKQYVWTSCSGLSTSQSGTITVPSGGGSITASYKTQYYLTVTSTYDSPNPTSGWFDAGTQITASVTSPVSGGTGTQYVCTGWSGTGSVPSSGTSTSVTFTINAPSSITWNWKTQYYLTMNVNPSGSGTVSPGSGWYDSGTQVQISATANSGYAFSSWSGSGTGSYTGSNNPATITMNGPITETANFATIVTVTFSVNGMSSDASGTVLTVDGTTYAYSQLPVSFTWAAGSQHSFSWSSPVSAGSGKQYVWVSTSGLSTAQSGTITVSSSGSITATYKTQYYLTMQANPSSGGSVSPSSGWYDSGSQVSISATPASNYRFNGWTGSGTGSYTGSSNPATVTMNGPITETANFVQTATVTFSVSGVSSDASGNVLTVDGTSYTYSQLPKSFTWDVGSSHSFSWASPVSAGSGKQYVWVSSSGLSTAQSGSITVPSGGGSVTASYKTQCYLTVSSAYDSPSPSSGWFDVGTQITASVTSPVSGGTGVQYVCTGWTGSGSVPSSGSGTSVTFTINAPSSITWNWKTQYYLTVNSAYDSPNPTSGWFDAGTSITASVTSPVSGGSGIRYVCTGWTGTGSVPSSGTGTSTTFTINAPSSITWNWKTQYYLTVSSAYDSPSPSSGWFDAGSSITASVTSPVSGGTGIQYVCTGWTGSGSVPSSGSGTSVTFTINSPSSITWNWKTQYYLTVNSAYDSPNPTSGWFDAGASITASVMSPTSGGTGIQYVCTGWTGTGSVPSSGTGTSTTFTINAPSSITWNWKTQYYLTMQANPSSGGSVSPSSGWYDSGTQVSISATPASNYRFNGWTGSGTGSYTGSNNPATVTMNGPITETANFVEIATVTFSATGLGSDASETVLTVDGTSYSYNQLPRSFTWDVGSSHSFSWSSAVSAGSGKQYVWASTSGLSTAQSDSITVPSGGGSVTASYKTQYYLTMQASPSSGGSTSPQSGWYDSGSQVSISATAASNYVFVSWSGSGTGSYTGTNNPATITMNGPITETANFVLVTTITTQYYGSSSEYHPPARRTFYASGRTWYIGWWPSGVGGNIFYASSADGVTWTVTDTGFRCNRPPVVYFDGTYVHIAYQAYSPLYLCYVRGRPNSDGTITFGSVQNAIATASNYIPLSITVDSNGYPWIGYRYSSDGSSWYPYVIKSSRNDGTWATASGFPYQLSTSSGATWMVDVVALTSGKVAAVYTSVSRSVYVRSWSGSAWNSQVSASTSYASTYTYPWLSAVAVGDVVYIAYPKATAGNPTLVKYTYSSNSVSAVMDLDSSGMSGNTAMLHLRSNNQIYFISTVDGISYKVYDISANSLSSSISLGLSGIEPRMLTVSYSSSTGPIDVVFGVGSSDPRTVKMARIVSAT